MDRRKPEIRNWIFTSENRTNEREVKDLFVQFMARPIDSEVFIPIHPIRIAGYTYDDDDNDVTYTLTNIVQKIEVVSADLERVYCVTTKSKSVYFLYSDELSPYIEDPLKRLLNQTASDI